MTQEELDERAGSLKPWWNQMMTLMIARPEVSDTELAVAVSKNRSTVHIARRSTLFKELWAKTSAQATILPQAMEMVPALQNGIAFTYSKGQIVNRAREVIMQALNDDSMVPVLNKEGELVGEKPAISLAEKAKLGIDAIKALTPPKSSTIIGKQINNTQNNNTIHLDHELPPALAEMLEAVKKSIPMRRIERRDGSQEFVVDMKKIETQEVEE